MLDVARHADAGRWDSIWVYDHFHTTPEPTEEATHEAWTLMAAFAATTSRVKLGQMCTCMSYRNPAYLAKVAATVDLISGGRAQMGIGGGWYEHEWRAYGYGFPRAGARLARLREGVEIMRQAWRTGVATLDGEHYQVDGALVRPLPLQPGGIPLWVAGGGEKVTLRIAAEYADYTNFDGSPEGFAHKSEILRGHCEAIGRPFEEITRTADYNIVVGRDDRRGRGPAGGAPGPRRRKSSAPRRRTPSPQSSEVVWVSGRRSRSVSALRPSRTPVWVTRSATSPRRRSIVAGSSSSKAQ